ncbi:MAG: HU family DNA-binding protein [Bacteroidales bacterium]
MSIKYDLYRSMLLNGREDSARYIPRPVSSGNRTLTEIADSISDSNTFTRSDVVGVLAALIAEITNDLKCGRRIHITGLGTFGVSLTTKTPVFGGATTHGGNVRLSRIHFRPSPDLFKTVGNVRFYRTHTYHADPDDADTRLEHIREEVAANGYVTCSEVMLLNHCSRKTAWSDLNELVEAEVLRSYGTGSTRFYSGTTWDPNVNMPTEVMENV